MNNCNVGVELEAENWLGYVPPKEWKLEGEAMLRNGVEFVLKEPLSGDKLKYAINKLCAGLTKETFTQRCSTHIHIDVRDLDHLAKMKFITAYTIFEPLLLTLINKTRVGNLFCMPIGHSEGLEDAIIRLAQKDVTFEELSLNEYKYGAINLASVANLGSLEFRALHGTGDPKEITNWIDLHTRVKDWSIKYGGSPADMMTMVSEKGCQGFCEEVLGELTAQFDDVDFLMYEGVRNAQYFAFVGDW